MSQNSQNRRNFLKSAAVGGAAMGVAFSKRHTNGCQYLYRSLSC